jgi:hypothetical protein
MAIATINPATGKTVRTFDELTDSQIDQRLARASGTFATYRLTTFEQRSRWLRRAAEILDADLERVSTMMTEEMGKTLAASRQEVQKCATACRFYAAAAPAYLSDELADAGAVGARMAYVRYQPLGPVLAIMPWNFPLWQAMRFAAPALMAGNVGLLKHASNVPQTALYMQELFERAGFPGQGGGNHPRPAGGRGHADRVRAGRCRGGFGGRQQDQKGGPRAGRQRPVRGHAVSGFGQGGQGRGNGQDAQQRAVVYQRQAVHRA